MLNLRNSILLVLAITAFACIAQAQTTREIGTQTSGNSWPFNYTNSSGRYQTAYSAAELNLPTGGTLIRVEVFRNNGAVPSFTDFRLRAAHSSLAPTALTTSYDANYAATLSTCIGPSTLQPQEQGSWVQFPCTTGFQYNGTASLLLDWSYTGRSGGGWTVNGSGRTRVYQNGGDYQTATGGTDNSGNWGIRLVFQIGPQLTVTVAPGQAQQVYANAAGPNSAGLEVASFGIECTSQPNGELTSVELEASGTLDASTDIAELKLYRDDNANNQFDAGTDVEIGTGTAFASSTGTSTLTVSGAEQTFTLGQTKVYFVVVKLNGMAAPGEDWSIAVSDIGVGGQTQKSGVPSTANPVLTILTPDMTLSDDSPSMVQEAILGTADNLLQSFVIDYPDGPNNAVSGITIAATGIGDDASAFTSVDLYLDDGDAQLDPNSDTLISSSNFTADDGTLTFDIMSPDSLIAAGQSNRYYITGNFNLSSNHGDTFAVQVTALAGVLAGTNVIGTPAPAAGPAPGVTILGNVLRAVITGPSTPAMIDNDSTGSSGDGEVMLSFTLQATNATWTVDSLIFEAHGTGDDALAYSELAVYEDLNLNGTFDGSTSDILAGTPGTAFTSNDGAWVADLQAPDVTSAGVRTFFLLAKFSGASRMGETFSVSLQGVNSTPPTNGILNGFPSQAGESFTINAASFDATLNGPLAATSVNNTAAAQLLADITLRAKNEQFTLSSISFTASGSGNDASAFSELALYEDDGDGVYSFANDTLATATTASSFGSDNGTYSAMLSDTSFAAHPQRRFFLVATLNGTALSGETFNASLSGLTLTSQSNTPAMGAPTLPSTALMIDNPVLTVAAAPGAPTATVIEKSGGDFEYLLGKFVVSASNGDIPLSSLRFALTGTGDWVNFLAPVNGVALYLDNGDGVFDASSDSVVGESGGAMTSLDFALSPAPTIPNAGSLTFFLNTQVLGSAGGSIPQTFVASINSPLNVGAPTGVNVLLGTPAPTTATLTIIEYFISSITPTRVDTGSFGQSITIEGSGFTSQVELLIDGVPCDGIGVVSPDGKMITGFMVPEHSGSNLQMILSTGLLGPRVLTQRFSYASESESAAAGLCSLSSSSDWSVLMLMLLLGLACWGIRSTRSRDAM